MEVKPITLFEYATRMDIKKSTLQWYVEKGLLKPTGKIGNTFFFDEEYLKKKMQQIADAKKKGKTLEEIKELLDSETLTN